MTKQSGLPKSCEHELGEVIKQMEYWIQQKTRLTLSISTPLFHLFLRGRIVVRQKRLFLFDAHGETCRVPLIPAHYDRVLCEQTGPTSVTFGTSEMQGELMIGEDPTEAGFAESCADWALSNMTDGIDFSGRREVPLTTMPQGGGVPITRRERHL